MKWRIQTDFYQMEFVRQARFANAIKMMQVSD